MRRAAIGREFALELGHGPAQDEIAALHDGQQMNATLTSLGTGLSAWLQ